MTPPEAFESFPMIATTLNVARKYGAKASAAAGSLVLSTVALAQSTDHGAAIVTKVESAFTNGELIAAAVVMGLFAIFAIKLLWRSK